MIHSGNVVGTRWISDRHGTAEFADAGYSGGWTCKCCLCCQTKGRRVGGVMATRPLEGIFQKLRGQLQEDVRYLILKRLVYRKRTSPK